MSPMLCRHLRVSILASCAVLLGQIPQTAAQSGPAPKPNGPSSLASDKASAASSRPSATSSQPAALVAETTPRRPQPLPPWLSVSGKRQIAIKSEKKLNEGLGAAPKDFDRSTPRRSWRAFVASCLAARWERAAHFFNLGDVPVKDQRALGVAAARKFCAVLELLGPQPALELDDTTVGPMIDDTPSNYLVVARIKDSAGKVDEAWLRNTKDGASGKSVWVLTRRSLSNVGSWYRLVVRKEHGRKAVVMINRGLGALPATLKPHSPRSAAEAFAQLVRAGNYRGAANLLDLSALPKGRQAARGQRLARRLALVLTRLKPGYAGALSNDPRGAPEQGVPDDEEQLLVAKVTSAELSLRLARYPLTEGEPVWLFSASSVAAIDALYQQFGAGWPGDYLPPLFFSVQLWEVQLWQWIGLLLGLVLAYIFGYLAALLFRSALLRAARLTSWQWDDQLVDATRGPMRLLFAALGFVIVIGLLMLHPAPQAVVFGGIKLVAIVAVGWFVARALDVAAEVGLAFFQQRSDEVGMAMVPVARRIFKPILWVLIAIVALQNVGINVAGLIAGLGIGGLALAMASKTTVENMLGGITIAFDRPFKVGDFIKVGEITGAVQEVGLRSTRIRTLDRTVVTVPNGQMADSKVENFAPRDRIRLLFKIGLQYDSSLDQVRLVIDEIKRIVLAHRELVHEGFRVRFIGFADSALEIEVYCYVNTTDYNRFTAIREELYLKIAEIVANAGAQFAYPTRTIYKGDASHADVDKALAAAALVQERSAAGELTIPEIPEAVRARLTGGTS